MDNNYAKMSSDMSLNDYAKAINDTAVEKGWWEDERSFAEIVALCHSELSEALEEDRAGRPDAYYITDCPEEHTMVIGVDASGSCKMEGKYTELCDCLIRILDYLGHNMVDVDGLVLAKMRYNESRPYRHGKRY